MPIHRPSTSQSNSTSHFPLPPPSLPIHLLPPLTPFPATIPFMTVSPSFSSSSSAYTTVTIIIVSSSLTRVSISMSSNHCIQAKSKHLLSKWRRLLLQNVVRTRQAIDLIFYWRDRELANHVN